MSPFAATTEPIGISPAFSPSAACSSAALISSEELEDTQRTAERRDEVDARGLLPCGGDQLARMGESDLGCIRAGCLQRVLQLLGDDDPRHLVVQAHGQAIARQREDPQQHRNRPPSTEPFDESIDVLEVEDDLRHSELRARFELLLEALVLDV